MIRLNLLFRLVSYAYLSGGIFLIEAFTPKSVLAASSTSLHKAATGTMPGGSTALFSSKHTLFDVPVSNNGARCRIVLYKKEISESEVCIVSPAEVGGLGSEQYAAINPLKKMPALKIHDSSVGGGIQNIFESDTIVRYLLTEYANQGPSFQPDNPKSNLMARIHDMYLTTIQSCMYRPPPFGPFWTRSDAIAEYVKQMKILNDMIIEGDMYLCGTDVSLADATIFPSMVFANYILPKFGIDPPLPSKLSNWFQGLIQNDPVFEKVYNEIMGGLSTWEKNDRWGGILGAGWKDTAPATIFDKIIVGDIPAAVVKEDDKIFAFKDINPAAPAHVLIIPKHRNALTRLTKASVEHVEILGRLMVAASEIAKDESLGFGDGARIVINDGPDGGQEVMHLHVHVLGGRPMTWPPG